MPEQNFFDDPILNSPYVMPKRHWDLDQDSRPTNFISENRRSSELLTALPGVSSSQARSHTRSLFEDDELSTDATEYNPSPLINDLRLELETWRNLPNPSQWKVSPTTQRLLQHWRALQLAPALRRPCAEQCLRPAASH